MRQKKCATVDEIMRKHESVEKRMARRTAAYLSAENGEFPDPFVQQLFDKGICVTDHWSDWNYARSMGWV